MYYTWLQFNLFIFKSFVCYSGDNQLQGTMAINSMRQEYVLITHDVYLLKSSKNLTTKQQISSLNAKVNMATVLEITLGIFFIMWPCCCFFGPPHD